MSLIPKKGTVYVVDDDEAVRDSLQWLLEGKDYRVRCFDSAETFLSRYDPREVACLIVDIRMGGMTGLELQDRLIERKSPLPIVFITGRGDMSSAVEGMRAGAVSFLPKPVHRTALLEVLTEALRQDAQLRASARERQRVLDLMSSLTSRERQVMYFVVRGYLNKQIAAELGTAEKTVKVHRGRLMHKLQARSVAALVQMLNSCDAVPATRPHAGTPALHHSSSPANP